jgi:hypothetical protein
MPDASYAWWSRLADEHLRVGFALRIEGCSTIFTSHAFTDLSGVALTPVIDGESYTLLKSLPLDQSISAKAAASKRGGLSPTTSLSLKLVDDRLGTLNSLFKIEGGTISELAANLDWSENAQMYLMSTASFPVSGTVYIGRERIAYDSKHVDGVRLLTLSRARYGSMAKKYSIQPQSMQSPIVVADYPRQWSGRWASLSMVLLCDEHGMTYDGALYGANCPEIFRGIIQDLDPGDDWYSWTLDIEDLTCLLRGKLQVPTIKGRLIHLADLPVPDMGYAGWSDSMFPKPNAGDRWMVIPSSRDKVHVRVIDSGVVMGTIDITLNASLLGDVVNIVDVTNDIKNQLHTELTALIGGVLGTYTGDDVISIDMPTWGGADSLRFNLTFSGSAANYSIEWIQTPDSFRFSPLQQSATWIYDSDTSQHLDIGPIPALRIPAESDIIPVVENADNTEGLPSTGAIRMRAGDYGEVIEYSASAASQWDGITILTASGRGKLGTKPFDVIQFRATGSALYDLPYSLVVAGPDSEVEWQYGIVVDGVSLFDLALQMLTSTDGTGINGSHDTWPFYGQAINQVHFDVGGFTAMGAQIKGIAAKRYAFITEELDISEFIDQEFALSGVYLACCQKGSYHRIRCLSLQSAAAPNQLALTSADVEWSGWPTFSPSSEIVNRLTIKGAIDHGTGEFLPGETVFNDLTSQGDYGKVQAASFEIKTLPTRTNRQLADELIPTAARIFKHNARKRRLAKIRTTRKCWQCMPGDVVSVTLAGVPLPDGTKGWTSETFAILEIEYLYWQPGGEGHCSILLERQPGDNIGLWSPAGRLASGAIGDDDITLDANVFTDSAQTSPWGYATNRDYHYFKAGDAVRIVVEGELIGSQTFTIVSRTDSAIKLSGNLTAYTAAKTYLILGDYSNLVATQKRYVSQSSSAGTVSGATAYQWDG